MILLTATSVINFTHLILQARLLGPHFLRFHGKRELKFQTWHNYRVVFSLAKVIKQQYNLSYFFLNTHKNDPANKQVLGFVRLSKHVKCRRKVVICKRLRLELLKLNTANILYR